MRIGPPTEHRAPTLEVGAFVFRDPQVEKRAVVFIRLKNRTFWMIPDWSLLYLSKF